MKSMQMKLIGNGVFALGHCIRPVASVSAAIFVMVAGKKRIGMIRASIRRLLLTRIMVVGSVLTKFDPKSVEYAYSYGYGYGYWLLERLYSFGYSGASDDPSRLATPTLN